MDHLIDNDINLDVLTETWLSIEEGLNQQCLQECKNNNFNLIHNLRNKARGGDGFFTQTDLGHRPGEFNILYIPNLK